MSAAEMLDHAADIPVAELLHEHLGVGRIGPGLVGGAARALLAIADKLAVLGVRRLPDLGQPLDIVVDAFDRVLVDEPLGAQQRAAPASIGITEKVTIWSPMKWCQEFGWVQNDRPPSLALERLPRSLRQAALVSIVCDSPSPSSGRRSVRKPVTRHPDGRPRGTAVRRPPTRRAGPRACRHSAAALARSVSSISSGAKPKP